MFLSPYAVIGMDPIYGEGWHYVRSRFRYFSESIKPARSNPAHTTHIYYQKTLWKRAK